MRHSTPELTAYCGLYCGDCIRYDCKASDLSDALLGEIEKLQLAEYAEVKKKNISVFENYRVLPDLLKAISKIKCETPCRTGGDGCDGECEILACVKEKNLDGCWVCKRFQTCEKFDFLIPYHGRSNVANLKLIKMYGVMDWVKYREKCYPWNRP